ncbi:hypothetical protein I7I50_11056 [Histoplasma capsulatum G186AR]|uniref:Uncharacterized protein n=1 Tax=Ajellomyces capsulatus TaxID=5037 RepID=A0A8H8D8Z8_AJECA|nr:hypothetical protein I7I52_02295 [Histoplasma capsulatum]QSS69681.1 hypothetical protein I7I50_11056 [Histoplasma capsulatum G186AR]
MENGRWRRVLAILQEVTGDGKGSSHFRRISPCSLATSLQVCGSCFFFSLWARKGHILGNLIY